MVRLTIDGQFVYVGRCDNEEDAARLVDLLLVAVRGEAPRNLTESFVEWLEAGCDGDVPAGLVVAALRRVGDVDVKQSDDGAEARDAASSVEDEIAAAVAKPEKQFRASLPLSDDRFFTSALWSTPRIKGARWSKGQGSHMMAKGVKTIGDLAKVDVDKKELAVALTRASAYCDARKTLWRWKRAAAALLDVKLGDKPPPKNGTGKKVSKLERTTKQQHALDVTARWAASRGGTEDEKLATEYAEALAAIARDCVANQQKKKKRRR